MAKAYYRLRDTGTSFFDTSTGEGVVATRVAQLTISETVRKAVRGNVLIEVDKEEGEKLVAEQDAALKELEQKVATAGQTKEQKELNTLAASATPSQEDAEKIPAPPAGDEQTDLDKGGVKANGEPDASGDALDQNVTSKSTGNTGGKTAGKAPSLKDLDADTK